jgi:hypothetical protein
MPTRAQQLPYAEAEVEGRDNQHPTHIFTFLAKKRNEPATNKEVKPVPKRPRTHAFHPSMSDEEEDAGGFGSGEAVEEEDDGVFLERLACLALLIVFASIRMHSLVHFAIVVDQTTD